MPFSWLVMLVVVYGVLLVAAKASSNDIRALLCDDTLWRLTMISPALAFGRILGMMATTKHQPASHFVLFASLGAKCATARRR
jgi:hypothetical protein